MSDVMKALQTLVDNGLTDKAVQVVVAELLFFDDFESKTNKRCCITYSRSIEEGYKCSPSDIES